MEQPLGWEFTKEGWSPDPDKWSNVIEDGKIIISMMSQYGDLKKVWNAANQDEVEDARRSFDHLVKEKKYAAFRVGTNGEKDEQIREFDPSAGKMILVPPLAGG